MAGAHRALVGHDLEIDAAGHRIEETCRGCTRRRIEFAGAERRDHLGAAVEGHELDLDVLSLEEAPRLRDVEDHIAENAVDAEPDRIVGERGVRHGADDEHAERTHQIAIEAAHPHPP